MKIPTNIKNFLEELESTGELEELTSDTLVDLFRFKDGIKFDAWNFDPTIVEILLGLIILKEDIPKLILRTYVRGVSDYEEVSVWLEVGNSLILRKHLGKTRIFIERGKKDMISYLSRKEIFPKDSLFFKVLEKMDESQFLREVS